MGCRSQGNAFVAGVANADVLLQANYLDAMVGERCHNLVAAVVRPVVNDYQLIVAESLAKDALYGLSDVGRLVVERYDD
jgi:hypothetical protein